MKMWRISACICAALMISVSAFSETNTSTSTTQSEKSDSVEVVRGVQFDNSRPPSYKDQPVFCGVSVGADLAGLGMAWLAKFGQYDAQLRVNFKQRYFAAFEAGLGVSNYTSERTQQHYNVHAPYFRVGADYNFANNPVSGNRIYAGFRYGFSIFNYDIEGPDIVDPTWGTSIPYKLESQKGRAHWGELVAGLEGRIWRFIHLGWSVRWKFRFSQNDNLNGHPFYVPGYGDNYDSMCFGGSFNVIIDIADIKNSQKKRALIAAPAK